MTSQSASVRSRQRSGRRQSFVHAIARVFPIFRISHCPSLPQRLPVGDYALSTQGLALDAERSMFGMLYNSEDRIEGRKAFAEKRDPVWKGR